MKSKRATGRATVVTELDEYGYIRWESFLEAQHPPSRKGEKPSDSCSAKCCGHSREFCTCPSNASLPTSTRTSPALCLLPADSQLREQESELYYRNRGPAREPKQIFFCPHPSVESHSVVTVCLETPVSRLKILHLQTTTFRDACKEAGRADDSIELKLPRPKRWQADCWASH